MSLAGLSLERDATSVQRRHYNRPPVREAIIQIAIDPPPEADSSQMFGALADGLGDQFAAGVSIQADANDIVNGGGPGLEYRALSGDSLVRARLGGFSFHRLPPYTSWEEWTPRAYELLEIYLAASRPTAITRVGVRYLNYVALSTAGDLSHYFNTYPEIAPGIPPTVAGFFMQVTIPHPDPGNYVVLRQAMIPPPENAVAQIVLDIQALRILAAPPQSDLKPIIASLHDIEIETFERCITNRTRELFD